MDAEVKVVRGASFLRTVLGPIRAPANKYTSRIKDGICPACLGAQQAFPVLTSKKPSACKLGGNGKEVAFRIQSHVSAPRPGYNGKAILAPLFAAWRAALSQSTFNKISGCAQREKDVLCLSCFSGSVILSAEIEFENLAETFSAMPDY